jgi:hypothetical protein
MEDGLRAGHVTELWEMKNIYIILRAKYILKMLHLQGEGGIIISV